MTALLDAPAFPATCPASEGSRLRQILPEVSVFAVAIIVLGLRHVLWWNLWEDQAAHQYMAWGIFHGMRPYVETIDLNWPGIILIHVLAYLMAGTAPWGLRSIDLLFQFGLLTATAYLLASWRIPRPMRLLVGCAYLMSYLATGWWWTAQRESFNWPLWVIGTLPFTVLLGPRNCVKPNLKPWQWFAFGIATGFSLWIKPTPVLALSVVVVLAFLLCEPQERAGLLRGSIIFCLGIIAVSLAFVLVLALMGSLAGFLKWGIYYALGAYAKTTWPWSSRFIQTARTALSPRYRPTALLLSVIGIAVVGIIPIARRSVFATWRRPLATAALLVATTAATAILQGKTNCVYHFLPMRWTFTLLAAVVWGVFAWSDLMRLGAYAASISIVVITFTTLAPTGPTPGTAAASAIKPILKPTDQVVMWGASTTLLAGLEHRTPFPIVGSTAVYLCTPPGSKYRQELMTQLDTALRNPTVKLLLVEQGDGYAMQRKPEKPHEILDGNPIVSATVREQYRLLPASTAIGFDVFQHVTE